MRKSKYTEEQIAFALKQAETGVSVAEVIRQLGVTERRSTAGRSTGVWAPASSGACGRWRRRTASSSRWWPT